MTELEPAAVLDTNVILKMFFQEDDSDKADLLLSRFERAELKVFVPSFVPIEFANVLWLRVRAKRSSRSECQAILEDFLALLNRMHVVADVPLLEAVLAMGIEWDQAAYDMAFVALARKLGIQFITADAKLYRKLASASQPAVLLKNLAVIQL